MKPIERAREALNNLIEKDGLDPKKAPAIRNVKLFYQENFTGALVNGKYLGMAKRHNGDQKRTVTGECYAISRAVHSLLDETYGSC